MNFKYLNTLPIISQNFNIPLDFLEEMHRESKSPNMYLKLMKIPKKNKKRVNEFREVLKINKPYDIFYKELLHIIELRIQLNKSNFLNNIAHGFVKGKGTLTNAKEHLGKKNILKIDIENFFNSISRESVEKIFLKLDCDDEGAKIFSRLTTYNNVLKEGLNTSPILANLYCYSLDNELEKLASSYNLNITRYSDDITFSSNENNFPEISEIEEILNKYDLKLNKNKIVFHKYGQSQYVTGLSISNAEYPRVPRMMKKNIRQQLYYMEKFPQNYFFIEDGYSTLRKIYGHIIYILGIEKELGKKYKSQFINILNNHGLHIDDLLMNSPDPKEKEYNVYHYIDESDVKFNDNTNHYLALTVISIPSNRLNEINKSSLITLKNQITTDLRNGLSEDDREKLFHYCEDNILVKEKYISLLRSLQFEAFIIFVKSEKHMKKKEYQRYYYKIFSTIMSNILKRYKLYNNYINVEENSKITKQKLEENLSKKAGLLLFNIEVLKKEEILLSIPDYMMGIFRDCMKKDFTDQISKLKSGQKLKEENKLNEIIDKIRLVIDLDNSKYYSRQNLGKITCRDLNQSIENKLENIIESEPDIWII